jgi:hypothetical protein
MINKGLKLGAINSKAMATSDHKGKSLHELCFEAKSLLPQRFRQDAWYIVVVCGTFKRTTSSFIIWGDALEVELWFLCNIPPIFFILGGG